MRLFVYLWPLLLGVYCPNAWAQSQVTIDVNTSNEPFMYTAKGEVKGIYPDLFREAFKRLQVELTFATIPFQRGMAEVERGSMGLAGVFLTTQRQQLFDYSAPLFSERVVLFTLAEGVFPYARLSDLKGRTLGAIDGWSYGETFDLERKKGLFAVETNESDRYNFAKLLRRRLDAVVATEQAGQVVVKAEHWDKKIVALPLPVAVNDSYLVFPKAAKMGPLLKRFDTAMAAMRKDGTWQRLVGVYTAAGIALKPAVGR